MSLFKDFVYFQLQPVGDVGHSSNYSDRPPPKVKFKTYDKELYRNKNKLKNTLYVPCTVNNNTTNALIDTAAQVTVMNNELFESLIPKPLLKKNHTKRCREKYHDYM